MTKRLPPNPDGLNRKGSGRGLKKVTRAVSEVKKPTRAAAADHASVRGKYVDVSALPRHEIAEAVDPDKPLTEKAKLFVKFWAQGESISSAAARAGYGDGATYAYRLVHYPQVKALYAAEKRAYEEAAQMTRKKVMDGLLEGIEMAKLAGEPASVITGWKTIGQMCGYFEPVKRTVDINISGNVTMQQMSKLSDAELLRVIQQGVQHDLQQLTHDEGDD